MFCVCWDDPEETREIWRHLMVQFENNYALKKYKGTDFFYFLQN